ncbi:MAG: hypothetical protein ACXAD7_17570 [Candidatus Kariarchaeaceae archaeon]|jgi:hypothetical protein
MQAFMIFQDNLAALSPMYENEPAKFFQFADLDRVFPPFLFQELLGDQCLFKIKGDKTWSHWLYGRLANEHPGHLMSEASRHLVYHRFPVAEYAYTSYHGPYEQIDEIYVGLEIYLSENDLKPIDHSVEVFPSGLPKDEQENTLIDIWLATDANVDGDRLSDNLPEALPKRRFNFYTS